MRVHQSVMLRALHTWLLQRRTGRIFFFCRHILVRTLTRYCTVFMSHRARARAPVGFYTCRSTGCRVCRVNVHMHTSSALTCSPHQRDWHPRAVPTARPAGRRATQHASDPLYTLAIAREAGPARRPVRPSRPEYSTASRRARPPTCTPYCYSSFRSNASRTMTRPRRTRLPRLWASRRLSRRVLATAPFLVREVHAAQCRSSNAVDPITVARRCVSM
jgi:hypothetical protein